ncbi:hypothetical protein OOT46_29040 [Aquabacterium sp. A7-Y]|nr:hypothetical protein [Aquabacterium sp. A7-Y]MCW7541848.1 hypothetical protein [Aquabacterium sp. A7-Y]
MGYDQAALHARCVTAHFETLPPAPQKVFDTITQGLKASAEKLQQMPAA